MLCYRCGTWDGTKCACADGITLFHGDARDFIADLKFDVVNTDPPYGLDFGSGTIGKRGKASKVTWPDSPQDVRNVYAPIVRMALLFCGRGIVTPGARNCFEYPSPADIGFIYQPCATGVGKWGRATAQPILFYGQDPRAGKHLDPIHFTLTTPAEKNGHPTPKPLKFAKWCAVRSSSENETIIDPLAGSGTTLVAAKISNRRAIGIEIEERYCEIAANRLRQSVLDFTE